MGFQVFVGAAHTLLDSLMAGASGGVLGFAAPRRLFVLRYMLPGKTMTWNWHGQSSWA